MGSALTQALTRPGTCWEPSEYVAKIVLTRNVGAPQASTSRASGRSRHRRRRVSSDSSFIAGIVATRPPPNKELLLAR